MSSPFSKSSLLQQAVLAHDSESAARNKSEAALQPGPGTSTQAQAISKSRVCVAGLQQWFVRRQLPLRVLASGAPVLRVRVRVA